MSENGHLPIEECETCIVGTGAAGGLLAHQLALRGNAVLSLEQGEPIDDGYFTNHVQFAEEGQFGITPDMAWPMKPTEAFLYGNTAAHALYAARDAKSTSPAADEKFFNGQIFRLNGKLNLWNGVALRYSARDFRGKDFGDSDTNWPIGYEDLQQHYAAVERLIGVCGTREGLDCLPDGEFIPPLPLRPADRIVVRAVGKVKSAQIRAIPNRKAIETRGDRPNHCQNCGECIYGCNSGSVFKFSSHLLPQIAARGNYRIRYRSKVVRLLREENSSRIAAAECLDTQNGNRFLVKAKTFILAAGTLESPRILFNSHDEAFPDGLANSSGALGCYLQDKVKAMVGSTLLRLFGSRAKYDLGCGDHLLIPRFVFDNPGFRGGFQAQVCHFLPRRPYYVDGLAPFPGWSKKWLAKMIFRSFLVLMFLGKPEVRRSNRLLPGRDKDLYGIPQVDVQYEYTESDRRMQASMIDYGRKIMRKCTGFVQEVYPERLPGHGIHYAGTCRMAASSAQGVVDTNLRSFDHENLYICDGSVMPDIAEKNLTLTLMALAHRLGEHLSRRL